MKKYRKSGVCVICNNNRSRINNSGTCDSCVSISKIGKARRAIIGSCNRCKRGPLTLAGGICKSCNVHGLFIGVPNVISHGEAKLREVVSLIYGGDRLIFNYRPHWLIYDKYPLEIDVAIPDIQIGFEYDGRVHHDPKHPGYTKTIERDCIKNKLCYEYNWTLFRVNRRVPNVAEFEIALREFDVENEIGIMRSSTFKSIYLATLAAS